MTKCIGIISYLPNDSKVRAARLEKLNALISRCDSLFGLPIIIIAQNWKTVKLARTANSKLIIYKYDNALTITGARRELRKKFLELKYDYLIMLDDDIVLMGDKLGAARYLQEIDNHPRMFGTFKQLTLQLFAISREVYQWIDFPDGTPEHGDFFEDMWLIMALKKKYPDRYFAFTRGGLDPNANAANDSNSTWYFRQFNKHHIGDNTRAMIKEL